MPSSGSFLRQIRGRSTSWRWSTSNSKCSTVEGAYYCERSLKQMEGLYMYGNDNAGLATRKRVMVVVDHTSHSKHAMMWALTHLANKGDLLTLLHIIPPSHKGSSGRTSGSGTDSSSPYLASSLGSLCKASRPEVEVEALVIQGPKLATVMNQVKKLEVTVLVLGQRRPSTLFSWSVQDSNLCLCATSNIEDFAEQCINNAECWAIGVRKQTEGMSGYLITTKRQKDFWLLA
ncbi:uncharacterized protein LOC7466474 isoform X3 [Populus trichocarpa]|uniref:uncharacterized protein LOC7466474 isoform X3 n=1 Tax=Populus trichocarpa TaxID=3694 RepID=UPI000D18ABB3|nr:uncharacterized protein LOC7466474 isoform X3 [Populus trichocarpa]|eukprot:XP_024451609.1 uncharacterized protein LOC7466474 isoform X3 [Populus trichocarpa]